MLRDENENFFYQSQTSRRERESRLRQFSREFSGITFIACLLTDIFKKRLLFSQNFLKSYVFFSREIWIKISFFETRTGIFFQHLVSRDENGNFFILISCFEKETRIWKSFLKVEREKINLILTRIPEIENSRYALPQPQLKPLHQSTPATLPATNTPAPLHQSTPASTAAGSQHQRSTSRTPVPSPFLEPQQPQRAGSNSNQQWGAPPQQLTAAQVVGFPGNLIVT